MPKKLLPLFLLSVLFSSTAPAAPSPGPVFGRYFVAAGLGDPAYRDGEFGNAAFKAPAAVAVSKDGKFLYVADMGNDAIRRVSFEQRSRVDTLAGGPGKAELLSPTALALYSEGSALFTIAGKAGLVMKVRTDNGQVSPVPNALSPVAATSLVMHPSADRLYALDARTHRLTALETATGRSVVLDMADPGFDLQGSLATNGQELYFLQAATGQLHRLAVGTAPLVGLPLDGLAGQKLAWERLGYLGTGAKGLVVDQGLLWVWDQTSGQFKRFNPATGIWADYPLRDFDGEWLVKSPPMPRSPFRPDPLPEAKRRPMFKGPLGMASDAPRNLFYIAEAQGNRILGLGHPSWEAAREDGMPDYVNAEKVPGVIRILLLGDSMSLSYDGEAGELPTVEGGFGKRLEAYLNAFSSLKGKGKRYEVLQQSVALGAMGGGMTSYLLNLPAPLRDLKADEVITLLTYMNVNCELLGMTRTKCPDDVCGALVDPFFFDQSPKEMMENYGPIHRGFIAWLKSSPVLREAFHLNPPGEKMDPGGALYASAVLEDPGYRAWVTKVHAKLTGKAVEQAKRDKQRYTQVLLPLRNFMGPGENAGGGLSFSETTLDTWIDGDLERIAADKGCDFINLTPGMRALQPTVFPVVAVNSHHYTLRGLDWAAMATALLYLEKQP